GDRADALEHMISSWYVRELGAQWAMSRRLRGFACSSRRRARRAFSGEGAEARASTEPSRVAKVRPRTSPHASHFVAKALGQSSPQDGQVEGTFFMGTSASQECRTDGDPA